MFEVTMNKLPGLHIVSREVEFDASHRLLDSPTSACYRNHGHRWRLRCEVGGFLDHEKMVINFGELKDLMWQICGQLDHQFINLEVGVTNATVEWLVEWIWVQLAPLLVKKQCLLLNATLWETPTCYARKELSAAYIAGMLDADGSIMQSGNTEIQMRISNTHLPMLESLKRDIGGGSIQKMTMKKTGPIRATKRCYQLAIPRKLSRLLCVYVLPFLRIKREQAIICSQFTPAETGRTRLSRAEWVRRAKLLTALSKANGHGRIWSADDMIAAQDKFRENRCRSSKKSYQRRKK